MLDWQKYYGGKLQQVEQTAKSDHDSLREQYRFIRSAEDDADESWEARLAKRYYAKLFREYAVVDLSRHKEGRLGMRWRTEAEVTAGTGQFSCGARKCGERRGLASFEVPFSYAEAGVDKQALVQVRLCPEHAQQLTYQKRQQLLRAQEAAAKKGSQKRRRGDSQPAAEQVQGGTDSQDGTHAAKAGRLDAALEGLLP
ncbi:hypothetical protein WJX81_001817 [Elliptochloris bilobata]|uniref:Protein FRA10AC1 n=1 Tax=Elliptochloris bilobata TaxID=381761 RepID=A0AAW1RPU4_9CHLO